MIFDESDVAGELKVRVVAPAVHQAVACVDCAGLRRPVVTDLYRLPVRTSCALVDEGMPSGAPSSPKKLPPQQNTSCAEETAQVCERLVSMRRSLPGRRDR